MKRNKLAGNRAALAILLVVLCCAAPLAESAQAGLFSVRDYGAVGDGKGLDTAAISRAVRACNQAGGGTVSFPAGQYVSGTLELLGNVTLHLESGAILLGSTNLADYGVKADYGLPGGSGQSGEGLKAGLIIAKGANNIGITGPGTIDGRGTYFVNANVPHGGEPPDFDKQYTRQGDDFMSPKFGNNDGPVRPWMPWNDRPGPLIILANCKKVVVRDVTLKDSHNWTLNIDGGENVTISGVDVLNNLLIPNNDGININARNARISDCNIHAGDDGIAANGCKNLAVANCVLVSRSSAIRFGGGRYCTFQNLVIRDSNRGIGIYGAANDILFSDILIQTRLHTGHWWGKAEPIHISVRPNRESKTPVKNVRFSNVLAESESGILIYGTGASVIQDISFDNIKLKIKGGTNSAAVGGNFDLRGLGGGLDKAIFKHDIPAMYCQYVDGLQIHGFDLEWADNLPDYFSNGIRCEHFNDLTIDGFVGRQAQGSGTAIELAHGNKVSVRNCEATEGTSTLLSLNDVTDQRSFINNNSSRAKRAAEGMVPAASQTALEHKNGDAVESPAGGSTTFTAKPIPVTPNASPEAGALLKFLYHLSGRYTMAGAHNQPNFISSKTEEAYRVTGKYPVLWGQDFGFSKEGDKDSITVRQAIVDEARKQFYEKGSIVTLMWHEIIPTDDEPTTFKEGVLTKRLTPEMWKELLTPESPLNRRWQAQVDVIAGYLKQLCDAKVPVIWRPYHEMNGGWFWWGQRLGGAPFQDLYKMMFNRFTKMHGLTNLLWTFDVNYGNQGKENYDLYYPGNELVDILAVDIYNNQFRQDYYEQLLRLGGGKPIAIGECGQMPTSEILGKQPRYLWFMVWSGMFNLTSKAAATELYNSPRVLTRDKMRVPAFATSLTGR